MRELALLYFIAYAFAVTVKNIFGSEITSEFNLNKKTASSIVVFYLLVSLLNTFQSTSILNGDMRSYETTIFLTGALSILLLISYLIIDTRWFFYLYRRFYLFLISLFYIGYDKDLLALVKLFKWNRLDVAQEGPQKMEYSLSIYFKHLIFHIPNFTIGTIITIAASGSSLFVLVAAVVLSTSFIISSYLAEFISQESSSWMTGFNGFGYQAKRHMDYIIRNL